MSLDGGRRAGARFDHIGIKRPLNQEPDIANRRGSFFKDTDEDLPNDLSFLLRVGDTLEFFEKAISGLDMDEVNDEVGPKRLFDLLRLAGAEEAMVDEYGCQLVANRFMNQGRGHCRIDTARQAADDLARTDLMPYRLHLRLDDRVRRPRWGCLTNLIEELLEDLAAPWGVGNLWVELDSIQSSLPVLHRSNSRPTR